MFFAVPILILPHIDSADTSWMAWTAFVLQIATGLILGIGGIALAVRTYREKPRNYE